MIKDDNNRNSVQRQKYTVNPAISPLFQFPPDRNIFRPRGRNHSRPAQTSQIHTPNVFRLRSFLSRGGPPVKRTHARRPSGDRCHSPRFMANPCPAASTLPLEFSWNPLTKTAWGTGHCVPCNKTRNSPRHDSVAIKFLTS
jgi:hypothetical protein